MLFWIVMQINQFMFGPIDETARQFLQFMSFLEVLAELVVLIMALGTFVESKVKK